MTTRLATSYAEARARFLGASTELGLDAASYVHPESGPEGEELAVDVVEVGAADAANVLLLVSGTHGVEGFAGSALQSHWLEHGARAPDGVRVVLFHAFNPFGFAWHRRTNEDNVDLNRNFIDWASGPPAHDAYDEIASFLVPASLDDDVWQAATEQLTQRLIEVGPARMQEIITSGQYDHIAGVFYGGAGPVWSHRWMVDHGVEHVGSPDRLGIVDLHTGLGPWGHGELIIAHDTDHPVYRRAASWWGEVRSTLDGESVSPELSGDWIAAVDWLFPGVETTSTALEYGTVDTLTVLEALRREGWMHAYGEAQSERADAVRAAVRHAFLDDDPAWLEAVTERFDEVIAGALAGLRG